MAQSYNYGAKEKRGAILLAVWLVLADFLVKIVARLAACGQNLQELDLYLSIFSSPGETCTGSAIVPDLLVLGPAADTGWLLGLGPGAEGFVGQIFALALIGIAWVATILVQRWRWKASEDPYLLAITWAGAITLALPRLVSAGPGLAEFTVGGSLMLTLGSVYFLSGLIFLGLRASAEANA